MVERTVDWQIISIAFAVTLVIMGGIYLGGSQLNEYKLDSIRNDIKSLEVEQQSQDIGFDLARSTESDSCSAMQKWIDTSTPKIKDLRKDVAAYESSSKFESEEYTILKKRYTNLVLQNMMEIRTLEQNCDKEMLDIVYVYSKYNCPSCEDQGTVLTYYRQKYDERLIVHPLDADLDMDSVNFIEELYNVTEYPVIIVDGEVHRGLQDKQELGDIIEENLEPMNQTQGE